MWLYKAASQETNEGQVEFETSLSAKQISYPILPLMDSGRKKKKTKNKQLTHSYN